MAYRSKSELILERRLLAKNEELALDFAGPFQNAEHGEKYMLVAIDNYSAWPDALFLHKPIVTNSR